MKMSFFFNIAVASELKIRSTTPTGAVLPQTETHAA